MGTMLTCEPGVTGPDRDITRHEAELAVNVEVETLGRFTFVRGRQLAAVRAKVDELLRLGGCLEGEIEHIDAYFVATFGATTIAFAPPSLSGREPTHGEP